MFVSTLNSACPSSLVDAYCGITRWSGAACYGITRCLGMDQGEGTGAVERAEECMIPFDMVLNSRHLRVWLRKRPLKHARLHRDHAIGASLCLEMLEGSLCLTILVPLCAEMLCLSGDTRARLRAATVSASAATAVTQIQHTFNTTKPLCRKIPGARARLRDTTV